MVAATTALFAVRRCTGDAGVAAAATACPALRELEFGGGRRGAAAYQFAHLTRLALHDIAVHDCGCEAEDEDEGGGESLWHLLSIAPRLEVLACSGRSAGLVARPPATLRCGG